MTITGNDERDRLLFAAMKATIGKGEPLALDCVKAELPPDFDLLPSELVQARHAAKLEPTSMDLPEPILAQAPEMTPAPEARLNQMQARHAVEAAAKRLDVARLDMRMARAALNTQRGKLAVAIEAWQNGGPRWTPEMEHKAMLVGYAANKGHGPRMNTRKHAPQTVIEGRGVVTGYKGNRRNGLPSEYQGRNVAHSGMFQGAQAKKI